MKVCVCVCTQKSWEGARFLHIYSQRQRLKPRFLVRWPWDKRQLLWSKRKGFFTWTYLFLIGGIIALQYCVGFCHTWKLSCFSHIQLFATPWTAAPQAPMSMSFFRQEYWGGLLCLPPGDLPDLGINPASLMFPELTGGFFTTSNSCYISTWISHKYVSSLLKLTTTSYPILPL